MLGVNANQRPAELIAVGPSWLVRSRSKGSHGTSKVALKPKGCGMSLVRRATSPMAAIRCRLNVRFTTNSGHSRFSFEDLVGAPNQRVGDGDAQRLGSL